MGGCATKPKVLKEDDPSDAMAPAPAPAPSISPRAPPNKEEDKVVKEAVVENDAKEKEGDVVDHDSVTKNSSLGNLFKENQEGKDSDPETVKVPDVSEVTTKEVEKTIAEDSSLKKAEEKKIDEEEDAKGKKTAATEEVVGEIADKKHDETNVVTPEEKNLDHIKPRVVNPDEKKPETQQQQHQHQQEQEEKEKKETDESLKPAIVHPLPPATPADQEKFATPKEKPEETYATTAKEEKKRETEKIQGEEQQILNK